MARRLRQALVEAREGRRRSRRLVGTEVELLSGVCTQEARLGGDRRWCGYDIGG